MTKVKGFKAMNSDMSCLGFKFKVGETYESDSIELCRSGFHFCENIFDVYNYYDKSAETVICEIEAVGEVKKEGNKSVTDKIKIIKKLDYKELLKVWISRTNSGDGNSGNWNSGNRNSGDWNSGYGNSGNRNSGDWNSGDGNSGNRNSGNRNSGNWNSGDGNSGYGNSGNGNSGNRNSGNWNSGDGNSGYGNSGYGNSGNRNSGYGNSGNWNSGYGNSGNRNSGDWNSGDGNSGYFNTVVPVYFFNKPSNTPYTRELEVKIRSINVKPIVEWIGESLMTEKEKNENPSYKTIGGFLRKTSRQDWRFLTQQDKEFIKSLPNFDNEVFKVISNGVSLLDDEVEIIVNGIKKMLSKEKAKKLGLID